MLKQQDHIRMDCNWIVSQAVELRKALRAKRLAGVVGIEARLAIKIEIAAMDYNELVIATTAQKLC